MHTIIKIAFLPVLALFAIVGVVSISKAEEIVLGCSFEAGKARFPNGHTFQQDPRKYQLMFNDQTNEISWLKGEKFTNTRVTETEIETAFIEDNGNIFYFNIYRTDGSAYHQFRSPYGDGEYAIGEQDGSCKKLDPTKKLF